MQTALTPGSGAAGSILRAGRSKAQAMDTSLSRAGENKPEILLFDSPHTCAVQRKPVLYFWAQMCYHNVWGRQELSAG